MEAQWKVESASSDFMITSGDSTFDSQLMRSFERIKLSCHRQQSK